MAEYTKENGLLVVQKSHRGLNKSQSLESLMNTLYPLGTFRGSGGDTMDLGYSKIGAAASYTLVAEVHNCVSSIVDGLSLLPWDITKYPKGIRYENGAKVDGEILASNSDIQTRHPFQKALKQFQKKNNFNLLGTMALDYTLYGEVFLEIASNVFGYNPMIEWLNPLGVQVYAVNKIEYFRYGWNSNYIQYSPDDLIYLHNHNPNDDFTGFPGVLSVLDKINILRNMDRFLRDYFVNNARPSLIIMPPTTDLNMSDKDFEKVKEDMRENLKGTGNQYGTWISQRQLQAMPLEQPDLVRNQTLSENQANAVYEVFSVPRAMRGNTSATPYKDGDETTRRFYLDAVLPLGVKLQQFINAEVMPHFDHSHGLEVFEFDTSAFDMVTAADQLEEQILNSQVSSGYVTLATAQRKQELPQPNKPSGAALVIPDGQIELPGVNRAERR